MEWHKEVCGNGTNDYINITAIKSYSPLQVNTGKLSFKIWGTQVSVNNISYDFKKPFTGYIKTWNDIKSDWTGSASIGTMHKYKLWLTEKSTLTWVWLSSYAMNDFSNAIEPNGTGLEIESEISKLNYFEFKNRNWIYCENKYVWVCNWIK